MAPEKKAARCVKCGKPATTKIVKIVNGKAVDLYLCDEHAEAFSPHLQKPAKSSLVDIIQHFLKQQGANISGMEPIEADTKTCPCCGLVFSAYRKTLLLGCSECYDAFEQDLLSDLRKMHGVTAHDPDFDEYDDEPIEESGDSAEPVEDRNDPAKAGKFVAFTEDPSTQVMELNEAAAPVEKGAVVFSLDELKQKMQAAIEEEDFEKAARIRDTLKTLKSLAPETAARCNLCNSPMTKFVHDSTGLCQVCSRYPACPGKHRLEIGPETNLDSAAESDETDTHDGV